MYYTSTEGHTAFIHRLICIKTYVHVGLHFSGVRLQKSDADIPFGFQNTDIRARKYHISVMKAKKSEVAASIRTQDKIPIWRVLRTAVLPV